MQGFGSRNKGSQLVEEGSTNPVKGGTRGAEDHRNRWTVHGKTLSIVHGIVTLQKKGTEGRYHGVEKVEDA